MQISRVAGRQTVTKWDLATVSKPLATSESAEVDVTCTVEPASTNICLIFEDFPFKTCFMLKYKTKIWGCP